MIFTTNNTKALYTIQNEACSCKKLINDPSLIHYAYYISDVIKELEKQSAYVGSHRTTEDGTSLLDSYSYTSDEGDLDRTLTRDAMAQVAIPLIKFAKGVADSYHYDYGFNTIEVTENHGYSFTTSYTYDSDTGTFTITVKSDKALTDDEYAIVTQHIEYSYSDILGGVHLKHTDINTTLTTESVEEGTITYEESEADDDGNVTYSYTFTTTPEYDIDTTDNGLGGESLLWATLKGVKVRMYYTSPDVVNVGDWLILTRLDEKVEYYVCHTQATTNNKFGCPNYYTPMPIDLRHTMHYVLYFPTIRNHMALKTLDTLIFDALVAYCMHKWFVMAAPTEAEYYWQQFALLIEQIRKLLEGSQTSIVYRPYNYV